MPDPRRVCVYVATKDRPQLLERAVRSVLAQSHPVAETFVVDDGSGPEAARAVRALRDLDPRVTVLRNEISRGPAHAWNRALREATSEFVTVLGDDDWFEPQRLAELTDAWRRLESAGESVAGLYTPYKILLADGTTIVKDVGIHRQPSVGFDEMTRKNWVETCLFTRRQLALDAGLYDEEMRAWQDWDLWLRISHHGRLHAVGSPSYVYDQSHGSPRISTEKRERLRRAYERFVEKHAETMTPRQRLQVRLSYLRYAHVRFEASELLSFYRHGSIVRPTRLYLRKLTSRQATEAPR